MKTDILIVGAGPVGIFTGFYAGMRGMTAVIVDKLEKPGGQLAALYPEKEIYDIAGFSEIKAGDLVNNLLDQVKRFEETTTFSLDNEVEEIEKMANGEFQVKTSKGLFETKTIIIAGGNGAFSPRLLGVEHEKECDNIDYFVDDVKKYTGQKVAIFGGGDSAVDWSLILEKTAEKVHLIHRREEFRAHDYSVEKVKDSTVSIKTPYVPKEINVVDNKVTSITIENTKTKELETVDVDSIICNFGFVSKLGPIENWNLELEKKKIVVDSFQQTSEKGIFAVGDICIYPGKAAIIANGFGEAPIAINSAYKHINPDAIIGALHSSSVIGGH